MTAKALSSNALDQLFVEARTHFKWTNRDIDRADLTALWDLARMGPTSMNCQPARVLFVRSAAAKEKLKPALMEGNVEKTMAAPATAIIATDHAFHENLPRFFPHLAGARDMFANNKTLCEDTAVRNATLQGAYVIMAARALGIDVGPMSGFDPGVVKDAFFADKPWTANFLINLGHGDAAAPHPRAERFAFDEACSVL